MYPGMVMLYHGPYEINGKKILFKEFGELHNELWAFSKKNQIKEFKSIEIYPASEKININFVGQPLSDSPFPRIIESAYVTIDGKILIETQDIEEYIFSCQETIKEALQHFSSLDQSQLLAKAREMLYWSIRPLYQSLGLNWIPAPKPPIAYDMRAIRPPSFGKRSKQEYVDYLMKRFPF
jgi:hypothetical protein